FRSPSLANWKKGVRSVPHCDILCFDSVGRRRCPLIRWEAKKEEFRKYLEKSGVIDALTKVLVGLYEEPERPPNAVDFIKRYMGAPTGVDVEAIRVQNDELKKENEELRAQIQSLSEKV
ncbi:unnamed protein product, partial [Chrysoparadoxa australica]